MRLHSIRIKMMLPIVLLAFILAGLVLATVYISNVQRQAMKKQAEHYFEAISEVLNADRDIYQARLAEEKLLAGEGVVADNKKDFAENAKQVIDRFELYRKYLSDEPQLLAQFRSFDELYQAWLSDTQKVINTSSVQASISSEMVQLDKKFRVIRKMLDVAGEDLRAHTREMERHAQTTADTIERYVEAITEVLNADRDIYQARLSLQKQFNHFDDGEDYKALFRENAKQVLVRFNAYRSYLSEEPEMTAAYENFDMLFNEWYNSCETLLESPPSTEVAKLPAQVEQADKQFALVREQLDKAGEAVRKHARSVERKMVDDMNQFQRLSMIVTVIAFLIAMFFGYLVPKRITKNVADISLRIREIAEGDGDLTQRIHSSSKDELGDLSNEFDGFVERLRVIISGVRDQSRELGGMTDSLMGVSEKAGQITHSLVGTSEQIVSAANQMTMSNQQMAEVAKRTANEANHSNELTQKGMDAVSSSSGAMNNLIHGIEGALTSSAELEKSSAAIASVLDVIRKIAEQTNLLALNAAIEAARAGEQGRGFAVVADEVRTLATRTQQSTNEIESMIDQLKNSVHASSRSIQDSRNHADTTSANFEEVSQIFGTLTSTFREVQEMAQQTSQATQEQADVSNSIMQNLLDMKEQTDGVEEVSGLIGTHSEQIAMLYNRLDGNVGSFKV